MNSMNYSQFSDDDDDAILNPTAPSPTRLTVSRLTAGDGSTLGATTPNDADFEYRNRASSYGDPVSAMLRADAAFPDDPRPNSLRQRHWHGGGPGDDTGTDTARSATARGGTNLSLRLSNVWAPETIEDEALEHPEDDHHAFFAKGRDFESVNVNHRYTEDERKILAGYESVDYMPSHSKVYKQWLKTQPIRLDWDRWIMMGLIGFVVGIVGFLNGQIIHVISELKWHHAMEFIDTVSSDGVGKIPFTFHNILLILPSRSINYNACKEDHHVVCELQ